LYYEPHAHKKMAHNKTHCPYNYDRHLCLYHKSFNLAAISIMISKLYKQQRLLDK